MIASVDIPFFTANIEAQHIPELQGMPFVVGDRALSKAASAAGIQPSMPPSRARALAPNVQFLPYTYSRQQLARDELEALLLDYGPQVEAVHQRDAQWYVGFGRLRTTDALYLGADIVRQLRDRMHLLSSVGLANGKFPAFVAGAASDVEQTMLVHAGEEAAFLEPFPVTLLPLDHKTQARLNQLGIYTLGDFAALPRESILEQFGKAGLQAHDLANGHDPRPVALAQPRAVEIVLHDFGDAVVDGVMVEETVSKLARSVAKKMHKRNLAGVELTLALYLDNHQALEDTVVLAEPTYNTSKIRQHLMEMFARFPITAAVQSIIVSVGNLSAPDAYQPSLFDEHLQRAEEFKAVLKHLVRRYGEQCFYRVTVTDLSKRVPEQRFQLHGIDFP